MDIQVQELIDKIKKEGIEVASGEASNIKRDAEAEARRIIESARKEADDIVSKGRQDVDRFEKAGIAAMEQAYRNLILAFKDEIQNLLTKLIETQIETTYTEDVLKSVLPELVKSWASKGGESLAVILSEKDLSKIEGFLKDKLSQELGKGVELKPSRHMNAGFRISSRDGSVYYDFSAESVVELLSSYVNSRLAEILKNAIKG